MTEKITKNDGNEILLTYTLYFYFFWPFYAQQNPSDTRRAPLGILFIFCMSQQA